MGNGKCLPLGGIQSCGAVGCALTHYRGWQTAMALGNEVTFFAEDDALFKKGGWHAALQLVEAVKQVDPNWQTLWFAADKFVFFLKGQKLWKYPDGLWSGEPPRTK